VTQFRGIRRVHFVGIGGVGMSGIAEVLKTLGYDVSGSDRKDSAACLRLRDMGVKVDVGHEAAHARGADVVVVSSAVSPDNPEVAEALRLGVPVIPRAEMLAELMRLKQGIAVAGSHGKTTVTSLVSAVIADEDPTIVIGGKLRSLGTNARLGQGPLLVAEADESDGSFLLLSPVVAVVTNIDREHLDHYRNEEDLKEAFLTFMNRVPFYGLTVLCKDDQRIRDLLPMVHRRFVTYGISADADLTARDIRYNENGCSFKAVLRGTALGTFDMPIHGLHNVLNALAAIAVGLEFNKDVAFLQQALAQFEGIGRRFELKGRADGIRVYDDYGHHPTEIRATLAAARPTVGEGRLIVLFQPHRYTRTRDLLTEFYTAFRDADRLYLLDIYPAGEQPIEGINGKLLADGIRGSGGVDVAFAESGEAAVEDICGDAREGDVILTLGAGDVWRFGEKLLETMQRGSGRRKGIA